MIIAQVTKYFHPHRGGIESNVLGISQEFAKKGHKVVVYTSNTPKSFGTETYLGIEVRRHKVWLTFSNSPLAPSLFLDLIKGDYDLLHVHHPDPFNSFFAYIASVIKNRPLYVTYHADIIKEEWYHKPFTFIYGLFLSMLLSKAEKIIATTPDYVGGSQIPDKLKGKVEVAPNFVDEKRFSPKASGERIRERLGLGDKKVVLFLGRLVPYKGVDYIIEAYARAKEEFPDSALVIAGRGPQREELEKKAAGVKDIVFTEVEDEEIPEYYAACDLFVLPSVSRQEAFGVALLEAMASEKAVISTNMSGMPYVVADAGLLVPPKDPEKLAKAMKTLLEDDGYRKILGVKGRRRVEKHFRQEVAAEKILGIYKKAFLGAKTIP